ncbi:MAG: cache domain-containing protein [Candidatus Omnitrophica bacterium]|nr:cache domain-containing protein [Candidatus Omnitrophota bacterium]
MKKLVVLVLGIMVFTASNVFAAADIGNIMPVLENVKQSINSTFVEIDQDLSAAAKDLSATDLKGDAARKILNNLRKFRPYVVDCSIVDVNGIKITVEPAEYKKYEGTDRSDLPSVISLLKAKKPEMSDVYHASEGMHAINIGYPIFSEKNGELLGAVRMLIRYEDFLKPLVEDQPCKIWVMQKNGLLVYDADPEEIGKNIFSDSMFKPFEDLVEFSKTVALKKDGAGSYDFYADGLKDKALVQKIAAWDTVSLYGTEWRVVAMEIGRTLAQPKASEAVPAAEK